MSCRPVRGSWRTSGRFRRSLLAFLDAGAPPVYARLRQSSRAEGLRSYGDRRRARARSARAGLEWRGRSLRWWMIAKTASSSMRSTNRRCSREWRRWFTTAALAPRRRPLGRGALRWWCLGSWINLTGGAGFGTLGIGAAHEGPTPTAESLSGRARVGTETPELARRPSRWPTRSSGDGARSGPRTLLLSELGRACGRVREVVQNTAVA